MMIPFIHKSITIIVDRREEELMEEPNMARIPAVKSM
jgi:hypothetical protein